jgi:hypothetical protein
MRQKGRLRMESSLFEGSESWSERGAKLGRRLAGFIFVYG